MYVSSYLVTFSTPLLVLYHSQIPINIMPILPELIDYLLVLSLGKCKLILFGIFHSDAK